MKEKLKKLWGRLPKLPRRWRIVRNLAAAAVLAVLALTLLEWPALSSYASFRRLEGAYLLTPPGWFSRWETAGLPAISPRGTTGSQWAAYPNLTAPASP